jgi:hypothetical protein
MSMSNHRHNKNRLINGMPCFVLLALLKAAAKVHLIEQALVEATKQSWQADKAGRQTREKADKLGRLTGQLGWSALLCAATSTCSSKRIFYLDN